MSTTPNLTLPYILAAQSQKHVTHNEAIRMLDAVVQASVLDRSLSAPPGSPASGARYIVGPSPTGAWAGQTNALAAYQDSAWAFYPPHEGWVVWIADEDILAVWDGAAWVKANAGGAASFTQVGINATADATNKLALASAASLFNHNGAGHQQKINKNAAGDTASQLFQTNFSGRAEWGLNGSDDMSLKVSPDGSAFSEAFIVDRTTAQATFAKGTMRTQIDTVTSSGTVSKPAWAKTAEFILIGAGGGGGAARRGATSTVRAGGGGGAPGAYTREIYNAAELSATLNIDIGAAGTGAAATTADDTDGASGTAGGDTILRDGATQLLIANGGGGGGGGSTTAGAAGAATSGSFGTQTAGGLAGTGTAPAIVPAGTTLAPGAGGGGSGLQTTNVAGNTSSGTAGYRAGGTGRQGAGGAGGVNQGNAGTAGSAKAWDRGTGGGGGGGRSHVSSTGGSGAAGGASGGGGGGAGAAINGQSTGAGGNGARGEAWVIWRG